jgi:alpha-1,3-rhamnosyl/mannosyltransferase
MRIGLDIRYAYDHFPGIGRYCVNLARALGELTSSTSDHTLVLLYNPALPNSRYNLRALAHFPHVELVATRARPFSLAEHAAIPRLARAQRLDVLHSPYYVKPYIGLPCPSIVTIYDLIGRRYPALLSRRARYLFRLTSALAVRTAARVITISRDARRDLAYFYRLSGERVALTPLAADPQFQPQPAERVAAVRSRYGLPGCYVLYFGSNKPHKNLERLIHAWERLREEQGRLRGAPPQLVIAGHYDPRYPEVQQMVEQRQLTGTVGFLPNVAEQDVPALYSGAEVFVFPSYYEGFGLPPLEAMACGVPVLCARASSLPEVVGDAALLVDPYNVAEIAAGLRRLLNYQMVREHLRQRGLRRARDFSWQRTAYQTMLVYEALAGAS